jgi:hypothetical protein
MSAIKAGQAYVEIATRQGSFDKGMAAVQASMARLKAVATTMGTGIGKGFASAQGALSSFSQSILSLPTMIAGSVAVTGLVALAKGFADAGSAVDDMAQRTGMSAEAVSSLGYVAKMTGADIGTVEKAVRKMQQGVADASAGVPGAVEKFDALGLSVSDLEKMTPDQQFIAIADRLSRIEDPALKSAAAMEYFGKAGADLVPMISEGGEGIQSLIGDAQKLGQVMSGEDAAAAAKLGDVFDQLWAVLGALQNRIGAAIAPLLVSVGETIIETVTTVSTWIDSNRELIVTIAQWAAVGAGLLAGLVALGGAAMVAGAAISGLVAVGGAIATVFSVIGGVLAAIASPVGLIVIGLTAAAGAALYFSGLGGEMVSFLSGKFAELKAIVMPVLGGIITALQSGQWSEAATLAMTGVELAFRVATRELYAAWLDWTTKGLNAWTTFSSEISAGAVGFVATIANVFAGIPTGITNGFSTVFVWLYGAWDSAVNTIAKKLLYLYSLFDKSVDYAKAAESLDKEAKGRADARQKDLDAANAKRNEELQRGNAGRLNAAQNMQNEIRGNAQQTTQGREAASAQSLAKMDEAITKLKEGMGQQVQKIDQNAGGGAKSWLSWGLGKTLADTLEQQKKQEDKPSIPSKDQVKAITATKVGGTFSGFAAGMMGGTTSAMDRMADETAKSNGILAKIAANTAKTGQAPAYGT